MRVSFLSQKAADGRLSVVGSQRSRLGPEVLTMANHNIPRRPLGKTGLEVSVLSFGGSPIGGIYQARLQVFRRSFMAARNAYLDSVRNPAAECGGRRGPQGRA